MLLSCKSTIKVNDTYSNLIGHMCYAAYKLWNVCNYERKNHETLGLSEYPNWYYQKKHHKDDLWYKQLPSQTAQEVCKQLDKGWKSFFSLKKSNGIENPNPPKFKNSPMVITYMQKAISHEGGSDVVRLSLPKGLKQFMSEKYDIDDNYLFLENKIFEDMDIIKQIKLYPPEDGECQIIVIYEVDDMFMQENNDRYLSIDLGLHNLMTCFNSVTGETFIAGRKYLSICNYFNKEIARVQSEWYAQQNKDGVKYPKGSKHLSRLYQRKNDSIWDYLHKVTRAIVNYCVDNDIHTVVIGDMTGIRKDNNLGHVTNQKLNSLPFAKIYTMLEYKLALEGITLVKQNEAYTSQTSPMQEEVSKENAKKSNRAYRGLYKDGDKAWNADCVGAFNILRKYLFSIGSTTKMEPSIIEPPYVLKVAV